MLKQRDCEKIRAEYPKGTQIELVEMGGEERMQPGLKGVVDMVDDMGQIHVVWENGSSLALNTGEDTFRIVEQEWKPYEKKMAAFLDRMYETLGNTDLAALNRSVNGPDTTLAHETLQKMQEAFEEVYGEEPMAWSEEYILAPAVFKGRESQVNALGLVVLDLQSSGEHCGSIFFTPEGIIQQNEIADHPNIAQYLKENFNSYEYWYTPAVEHDIHMDFENVPEDVQKLAGELFPNQYQGGPDMNMC